MVARTGLLAGMAVLLGLLVGCSGSDASDTASRGAVTGDDANLTEGKRLLDCNVFESGGGPDQQVTVYEKNGTYTLKELTNHGSMEQRALSKAEWDKRDIVLRRDRYDGPNAVNRLYKDSEGSWVNEAKDDGFNVFGFADCFTDQSK